MRRLAVLLVAGAAFLALAALAAASVTPTVKYRSPIKERGKPKRHKPVNITYTGILDVSNSDGTQPDTAPTTKIYFAKGFVNNAKHFPSCTQSEIDGATSIPKKCRKAVVGRGVATSWSGSPGTPLTDPTELQENLKVTAYNGNRGKEVLLALTSGPPVPITNRVIPGKVGRAHGKWAYAVTFHVPKDLQEPVPGVQVALTHFKVVFPAGKTRRIRVHGRKQKVSYLQLSRCPKRHKLPVETIVKFNNDSNQPGGPTVRSKSTTRCR